MAKIANMELLMFGCIYKYIYLYMRIVSSLKLCERYELTTVHTNITLSYDFLTNITLSYDLPTNITVSYNFPTNITLSYDLHLISAYYLTTR